MTGIEKLSQIKDSESRDNIREMTECFVEQLNPLKVILFGSFANGSYTDESDFDFYIVVDDERNISDATDKAYRSVRYVKKRPVDIVVGTNSRFERKRRSRHSLMVEGEVQRSGILLYDQQEDSIARRTVVWVKTILSPLRQMKLILKHLISRKNTKSGCALLNWITKVQNT